MPGFGGTARQPLLVKLARALEAEGVGAKAVVPPRGKVTPGLERETQWLQGELGRPLPALIGRSFGGRVAARVAVTAKVPALVLLGFPIRPPDRPRPLDEAALSALTVPTLILQGSRDELGPLSVLEPLVAKNANLRLEVLDGAEHSFGRHETAARERCVEWLVERLGKGVNR